MALWTAKTVDERQRVMDYNDKVLRAALLALGRALAQTQIALMPQYLSSPSNAPSTLAVPAVDSVAGILATLDQGQVVPKDTSNLAGSGSPLASEVIFFTTALNNLLASNFTTPIQQRLAVFVGSQNLQNVQNA